MAQSDDLDLTIDGFDPDIVNPRNRRHRNDVVSLDPVIPIPESRPSARPQQPKSNARSGQKVQDKETAPKEERPKPVETPAAAVSDDGPRWMRWGIVKFLRKDSTRLFLGIALILMSLFLLVAFVSHLKNGAQDQSIVLNTSLSEMAQDPGSVKNAGGSFGAWLSQVLMCDTLGLGSLPFLVYFWLLALGLLGLKKCNFWSVTFKTLLVSITTSIVLGLVFMDSDSVFKWGGLHGYYVNQWIISYATILGASLFSALLIVAVVCVYLTELTNAWKRWRENVNRRRIQEQLRRERKRELENAIEEQNRAEEEEAMKNASAATSAPLQEEKTAIETPAPEPVNEVIIEPEQESLDKEPALAALTIEPAPAALTIEPEAPEIQMEPAEELPAEEEKIVIENGGFNVQPFSIDSVTEPAETVTPPAFFEPQEEEAEEGPEAQPAAPVQAPPAAEPEQPVMEMEIKTQEIQEASRSQKKPERLNPCDEFKGYLLPKLDLLKERDCRIEVDMDEQEANKERIVQTLLNYNIRISKIEATVGPTVTLYEIVPAEGVRISQIQRLENDIALSLSALGIRIIAPIPGQGAVGIEVPNKDPQTVSIRSVLSSQAFQENRKKMYLPMAMGATISNEIFMADLTKMPHMLVAGATGMGKSVGLNTILASLLYSKHPAELKFVLVDPKMVEFSLYAKIERYFLAKLPGEEDAIITDPAKVVPTLSSLCIEMDNRYALLKDAYVRNLEDYNQKFQDGLLSPEDGHRFLPYIVVVVDEFADLIMTSGKEVEMPISRITAKARAVGIHMILATQRPTTNVITGLIKANIPGRVAFRVIQMLDSRTILDCPGANQLIGKGDMLFSHNGKMTRVQCAFISTEEVEAMVDSIYRQVGPNMTYILPEPVVADEEGGKAGANIGDRDTMFDEVARFIVGRQISSVSSLQRQFGIGYNRAGRLMDQMEAAGIVGRANGAKPRDILVDMVTLEHMLESL